MTVIYATWLLYLCMAVLTLLPCRNLQATYSPSAFCAFLNFALFLSSSLLSSCLVSAVGPVLAAGTLTPENLTLRPCMRPEFLLECPGKDNSTCSHTRATCTIVAQAFLIIARGMRNVRHACVFLCVSKKDTL